MTPLRRRPRLACLALTAAALAACGGGAGVDDGSAGTGTPASGTLTYSAGVMTRGSVILNGVRYGDTAAQIDDDRKRTAAQLADGMRVKLRGRVADDGVSGTADRLSVEPELRGTVASVDTTAVPPVVVVAGVRLRIDAATAWTEVPTLATLPALVGQRIEVHGLRDAAGTIRATRVETALPASVADLLKGPVSAELSGRTFAISGGAGGPVTVTLGATPSFLPSGSACIESASVLAVGRVVEVQGRFTGTNAFTADRIECEDLADEAAGVRPAAGSRSVLEGFLTSYDAVSSSFSIGTTPVTFTTSTAWRGGVATDLANGRRVEVDGTLTNGRLVARVISFRPPRGLLQGEVTAVEGRGFVVLGRTMQRTDLTRLEVVPTVGSRVEVRVAASDATVLTADEIRSGDADGGRDLLQAPVTAKTAASILLLGLEVTLPATPPSDGYRDAGTGRSYGTLAEFIAAITAQPSGGTVVKVRSRDGAIEGAQILR